MSKGKVLQYDNHVGHGATSCTSGGAEVYQFLLSSEHMKIYGSNCVKKERKKKQLERNFTSAYFPTSAHLYICS